jgi:quinol monooxygenase YgiN
MLIQSIRFTFAPEDAGRVADILKELQTRSLEEPGVVNFRIARSKDDPAVFALWEEYRDDAALKAHVESAHFARLVVDGLRKLAKERRAETYFAVQDLS